MDTNAVNYNPDAEEHDGFCKYRYLMSVTINSLPFFKDINTLESWDDINIADFADIKFYLKKKSEYYWETETPVAYNNVVFPYSWFMDASKQNYLVLNEEYVFLLSDEDDHGRERIYTGIFVPQKKLKNDKIILKNDSETVEIELEFIVF